MEHVHLGPGKLISSPRQHHCVAVAPVGYIGAVWGPLATERGPVPVAGAAVQVLGRVDAKFL